jgi:hypothetical protein
MPNASPISNPTPTALVVEPAEFVTVVDNPYFPLRPERMMFLECTTDERYKVSETYVTQVTKRILGVNCVLVRHRLLVDGQLVELTLDWYAQDKSGNVWHFGEASSEYEHGTFVTTKSSWEAGVDGATPGIIMWANPQVGQTYRQEYSDGEAEDMAKVVSLTESVTVPYGSFDNVLMIEEWTRLEPGIVDYKFYVSGLGLVMERKHYHASGLGLVLDLLVPGRTERMELVMIVTG